MFINVVSNKIGVEGKGLIQMRVGHAKALTGYNVALFLLQGSLLN